MSYGIPYISTRRNVWYINGECVDNVWYEYVVLMETYGISECPMEAYGISEYPNGNVWYECLSYHTFPLDMYRMCVCPSRNVWYK